MYIKILLFVPNQIFWLHLPKFLNNSYNFMKKSLIVVLLICLAPIAANSQALIALLVGDKIKSDQLKLGFFLGEQSSFITGANTIAFKPNLSFTIGAYLDVKIGGNDKWILQNYLIFKAPKGASGLDVSKESLSDNPLLNDNMEMIKRTITYGQLTPVMRFCFTPMWSVGFGPYVGLKLLVNDHYSAEKNGGDLTYKLKTSKNFVPIDFGTALDIQCRLLKGAGLQLNLRYEQGVVNIYKSRLDKKGYNMAFHFGVGIPMKSKTNASKI